MQNEITIRSKIMREDIWKWNLYPILSFFQANNFYVFFYFIVVLSENFMQWNKQEFNVHGWLNNYLE